MKIKTFALTLVWLPIVALTLTGCSTTPKANVPRVEKPGLIQGGIPVAIVQDPVTIAAIDTSRRLITLQHANGTRKTFNVSPAVLNLDQVKVGDTIKASVKAELAVYILENGRLSNADGTTHAKTSNFNAKVLKVDAGHRRLTLQFANGKTMTIQAGHDVRLEKMAPGDDVVMRSNVVTAITIRKS